MRRRSNFFKKSHYVSATTSCMFFGASSQHVVQKNACSIKNESYSLAQLMTQGVKYESDFELQIGLNVSLMRELNHRIFMEIPINILIATLYIFCGLKHKFLPMKSPESNETIFNEIEFSKYFCNQLYSPPSLHEFYYYSFSLFRDEKMLFDYLRSLDSSTESDWVRERARDHRTLIVEDFLVH